MSFNLKSARGFKQYMCCRFNAFVMNVRIMTQKQLVQKVWMPLDGDDGIEHVIGLFNLTIKKN